MGHIEWGRLPDYPAWNRVVDSLRLQQLNVADTARATTLAAEKRLIRLQGDPSLSYCIWLLLRLATAARTDDFREAVTHLGLEVSNDDTALSFIAQVADVARERLRHYPESGPFGEMAALALRRALSETVGSDGQSLFDSSVEDIARAFRRHSTGTQFGQLATRFFADFYARTLHFYIDRELANAVGHAGLPSLGAMRAFDEALDRHARQSAVILDRFTAEWYLKKRWERQGAIGLDDAQAFATGAVRKLRHATTKQVAS
jgi:hypothetical protein